MARPEPQLTTSEWVEALIANPTEVRYLHPQLLADLAVCLEARLSPEHHHYKHIHLLWCAVLMEQLSDLHARAAAGERVTDAELRALLPLAEEVQSGATLADLRRYVQNPHKRRVQRGRDRIKTVVH